MRKFYITTFAALLLSSASFAQQYEYKLTKMTSQIVPDDYTYMYDEANGRLDSSTHYDELDGYAYDCAYKYVYDEKGNEILEKGYQKLNGEDFYTYTTQIRYTYDDQGRLTSRTNFNLDFDGVDFMLGGVYEYIYDGDKLVQRNAYWDEERTDKFEEVYYTYDSKGRLTEEDYYSSFFGGDMEYSNGYMYVYDDQDRLIQKINTFGGGEVYKYNDAGNVEEWYQYSYSQNAPTQREIYTFDTSLETSKTLYPVENEWQGTVYLNSKNAILSDTVYSSDWDTGELGLYDVYEMKYEPVVTTGISTVRTSQTTMQIASFDDKTLRLKGVKDNESVRVYSASGLMMNKKDYDSKDGIDMSSMPSGAYIISTDHGSVKVLKK